MKILDVKYVCTSSIPVDNTKNMWDNNPSQNKLGTYYLHKDIFYIIF